MLLDSLMRLFLYIGGTSGAWYIGFILGRYWGSRAEKVLLSNGQNSLKLPFIYKNRRYLTFIPFNPRGEAKGYKFFDSDGELVPIHPSVVPDVAPIDLGYHQLFFKAGVKPPVVLDENTLLSSLIPSVKDV